MQTVANFLRLVTGSAPPSPTPLRSVLRAALGRRDEAQRVLDEERAATDRVHAVIDQAAEARSACRTAEAAAIEASTRWSASGAAGDPPPEIRALIDAAEGARGRAYAAEINAKGAREALTGQVWDRGYNRLRNGNITEREAQAYHALEQAQNAVKDADRAVLADEILPRLQRVGELHAELCELIPALAGYRRLGRQNVPYRPGYEVCAQIDALLQLPTFTEAESLELMQPWLDLGNRLLTDSDASF